MKKNTKKQIPKVRLPKYFPGGIHEEGHEGSADQPAGSENFYNQGRTKKINNQNAGMYAQIGVAAANTGAQLYANRSLTGAEKGNANASTINNGVDSVAGAALPWYGYAKAAEGIGKSFLPKDDYGNYKGNVSKAANEIITPDHEQMINDAAKGNYAALAWDSTGMGKFGRMASDLTGNSNKTTGTWGKINKMLGVEPDKTANSQMFAKFGGQMKYAMGGMKPNAEVEGNEMITSNVKPQVLANGGVELASNNPYSAPTYKTNGATHEDGGIPVNMQPGSIINGKTKVPAFMANKKGETFAEYMKKLANEENSVVKLKDNILKKAEKGDKYSKNSSDLLSLVLDKKLQGFAELKNKANNIQNAIIANKEQLKAIRKGELPSMDNEQAEPQGMSEQSEGEMPMNKYGGMYAAGGIHINPANKGKFTASAQHAGMGTQEFARHVLANKEDYSSTQVKRANFAHNAAGWKHEMGGIQQYEIGGIMDKDPPVYEPLSKTDSLKITNLIDKNPRYDLKNYNFDVKRIYNKKGEEIDADIYRTDLKTGKQTLESDAWKTDNIKHSTLQEIISRQNISQGKPLNAKPQFYDTYKNSLNFLNQKHAMGGVQLPYYNTNNDGTPKYSMGGFNNDTLFNNAGDPPTKITGGYANKPDGPNDIRYYWVNNKQVIKPEVSSWEKKGLGTGMTIDQSNQINKARGAVWNKRMEGTPQNLPKFEYLNDPSKGSYDQQFNEYKKVYLPGFKYGGNMPKYYWGGVDGKTWIDDNQPTAGFQSDAWQQSSGPVNNVGENSNINNLITNEDYNKFRQHSLKMTNSQIVGPTDEERNIGKITDKDNISLANAGRKQAANKMSGESQYLPDNNNVRNNPINASIAKGVQREPSPNKINWSNVGTNVAMGLANNAGNIADLGRYSKSEVEKYQRMVASLVDSSAAMRDAEQEARRAEPGIKNASAGSTNIYLANRIGLNASNIMNKDRLRQQYANINAGINNSTAQYNNELSRQEVIANAQNRAATRSGKNADIDRIGYNVANQMMDNKKGGMDQKTLALLMKYYDTPEFKKLMKDYKG